MKTVVNWERKFEDAVEIIFRRYDISYNSNYDKRMQMVIDYCLDSIEKAPSLKPELLHSKQSMDFFVMQSIMYCIKESR